MQTFPVRQTTTARVSPTRRTAPTAIRVGKFKSLPTAAAAAAAATTTTMYTTTIMSGHANIPAAPSRHPSHHQAGQGGQGWQGGQGQLQSNERSQQSVLRTIRTRKMHRLMMVASEKSRKLSADKQAPFRNIVLQRSFCMSLTYGYKQLTATNAINSR